MSRDKYRKYEEEKRRLLLKKLSPEEYEEALRQLCRKLKI